MAGTMTSPHNQGFTLVELAVVMVLIVLMAGFSLWGYHSLHQAADINKDINQITAMLKTAQNWAFTRKLEVRISITGKQVEAKWYNSSGTVKDKIMPEINLTEQYSLQGTATIIITPRGTFSTSGSIYRTDSASTPTGREDCMVFKPEGAVIGSYNGTACDAY